MGMVLKPMAIRGPILFFLLTLAVFLAVRVPFLTKEYAPEEAAWIRAGQGVAQTGFPWTYLGEQTPGAWAYWKGPLFPWLLGAGFKVFGEHEWVARGIPLLFALGQIILVWLISIRIWGKEKGRTIGLVAAAILAIHPFAIQNAVQVDIDGGLVGFFALLILYAAWPVVNGLEASKDDWRFLFGASFFSFLTRFDTSLMIFFALAAIYLTRRGPRAALQLCLLFLGAIVLYFAVVGAYNASFHQFPKTFAPFQNLVRQAIGSFGAKLAAAPIPAVAKTTYSGRLSDLLGNRNFGKLTPVINALLPTSAFLTVSFAWLTLPFTFLIIFICAWFLKKRVFRDPAIAYLGLPAFTIFLAFTIVAPSFNYPRYIHTVVLLIIILISWFFTALLENGVASKRMLAAAVLVVAAIALLVWNTEASVLLFADRVRSNPIRAGEAAVATGAAGAVLGLVLKKDRAAMNVLLIGGGVYLVFAVSTTGLDLGKPYSLNAYYGNYGFKVAAAYLDKRASPSDTLITVDTLGYYYGRPYYDINLCNADPASCETGRRGYIADYDTPPNRFDALTSGLREVATFGTIHIYQFGT